MKKEENNIDLSLIKENDLDKTSTFTDLMSRSERKKYLKEKEIEDNTMDFQTEEIALQVAEEKRITNFEEEVKKTEKENLKKQNEINAKKKSNKEKKKSLKEQEEEFEEELSKTKELFALTNNINLFKDENKHNGNIINIVIQSLFIITMLTYYILSIVFTEFQDNQLYLLINGISTLVAVLIYCIISISKNKLVKIFSVFNYLIIIGFIIFNTLIYLDII